LVTWGVNTPQCINIELLHLIIRTYTCKRGTRRWPLCLFMNILDVAAVAAYVIWVEQMPDWDRRKTRRRNFLSQLAASLVLAEQEKRLNNPHAMQKGPKLALQLLGFGIPTPGPTAPNKTQGRCYICPRIHDKKTRTRCITCHRFCCGEHSAVECLNCG